MNDETRWNEAVDRTLDGAPRPDSPADQAAARAAAAATRALAGSERPPESLRQRLRDDARRHAGEAAAPPRVLAFPGQPARPTSRRGSSWFPRQAWGWQLAAAAGLVLALFAWIRPGPNPKGIPPTPAEARRQFERDAQDAVRAAFVAGQDRYRGMDADVAWSAQRQDGFLRLRGLPSNDPSLSQYQLWIVDPERDELPVDGGVFDIPPGGGEALIHFKPRLPIRAATTFVITREIPGGVVRSRNPAPVAVARL